MQQRVLLHKLLKNSQCIKHEKRIGSVVNAALSLTQGADLFLTGIGRHLPGKGQVRTKIQKVNYLLGNGQLLGELNNIYQALGKQVIGKGQKIDILIDWSTLVPHELHLLRASCCFNNRSLVLYEEVHPECRLGKHEVQGNFLTQLKAILPEEIEVTIIVDAGFQTNFFMQVKALGWDYIGRILSNMHYCPKGSDEWQSNTVLYKKATSKPKYVGNVTLAKSNKIDTHLYLYKKTKKTDKAKHKRKIKHGRKEKEYSNAANKPWLVASSIKTEKPHEVMLRYKRRMKIEHEFRDIKDPRWGLGFRRSGTTDLSRIRILLMLAALAIWLLWVIGFNAEEKKLHLHFQANSIKHKRVLSLVFLGLEIIRCDYLIHLGQLKIPNYPSFPEGKL